MHDLMDAMNGSVLATDYDGTLAEGGRVSEEAIHALERLRASGRKLVLVTGRVVPDLARVFPRLDLFDAVVAENGAVMYDVRARIETLLAPAPDPRFEARLRAQGVTPLDVGSVIIATTRSHESKVAHTIAELAIPARIIFNEESLMVLPEGVDKGTGVRAALAALGVSPGDAVAIGDAENDLPLLTACRYGVAIHDSPPELRAVATHVTQGYAGSGFVETARSILALDAARA